MFIMLEIILVSCHDIFSRLMNAKKVFAKQICGCKLITWFTLNDTFYIELCAFRKTIPNAKDGLRSG